jgi:hypothetical protein
MTYCFPAEKGTTIPLETPEIVVPLHRDFKNIFLTINYSNNYATITH